MIRHTVVFRLIHPVGSPEEKAFLDEAQELAKIPTVRHFEKLKQVSKKNGFTLGLSMEFDDQAGYDTYNQHPDHVRFVQEKWIPNVAEFMEIDYEIYS